MISESSIDKNKKRRLEISQDSEDGKQKELVKSSSPPPPKTKLPPTLVVDLPPSLTTTYTYDVDAFSYAPRMTRTSST